MTDDVNPDLEPIEPDTDDEPDKRTDPDEIGGDEGDDKGPVPYERFKEVNDALRDYKSLGLSPAQTIERLSRLGVLEQIMSTPEAEPDKTPKTEDERAEAYQKAQAKKLILELFPHLEAGKGDQNFSRQFREANATEAWYTTVDVMEEAGMDVENPGEVRAIAAICKELIEADPRLNSKYMSGKADQAVKGAFKKLRKQLGVKDDDAGEDDPRPAKIRDKKKLTKLSKTPKGGGAPRKARGEDEDEGPKSLDEADKNILAKLGNLGA